MSMVIYVGLDVHLNSIAAVWGRAKDKPRSMTVTPDEEGLKALVKAVGPGEVWGVYEASSCGFEVYDRLRDLGWKMSIVAPTHIAKSVHGKKRKTDLRDAKHLWEILMSHGELGTRLPEIWIPSRELQEEREIVRRRLKLSESSCRVKNGILSLLRMHKIKRPQGMKSAWTQKHVAWLRGLAKDESLGVSVRTVLGSYVRELDFVQEEIETVQKAVETLAEKPQHRGAVEKMTQVPGVGTLTALTFLLEMGELKRFDNRRQVGCYLGLVPASYESGDADDRKGHITRLGPPRVRKVLNQAAWHLVRLDPLWRKRYEGIAGRGGAKTAIVAIMRKLGIELWQRAKSG
ncbi:MAG: IS110 family transposase [Acidobacteria bacterium]|nr:IS110 family transposase [Acidobacteriota bacterium]